MRNFIKYTPSILIWNLEIIYNDNASQNIYFLSHRRAERFLKLHMSELDGCKYVLGGEQLWLW